MTDVNDNPPFLSEPRQVKVPENAAPREVARAHLGDRDLWGEGHGPPFTIQLDPRAPAAVREAVEVIFNRGKEVAAGLYAVQVNKTIKPVPPPFRVYITWM